MLYSTDDMFGVCAQVDALKKAAKLGIAGRKSKRLSSPRLRSEVMRPVSCTISCPATTGPLFLLDAVHCAKHKQHCVYSQATPLLLKYSTITMCGHPRNKKANALEYSYDSSVMMSALEYCV